MSEGGQWFDVREYDSGVLPDPMSTVSALERVSRGSAVLSSRDELGARWSHRAPGTAVEIAVGPLPVGVLAERVGVLERIAADEGIYPGHRKRPITAEDAAMFGALVAYGPSATRDAALVIPANQRDMLRLSAVWVEVASFLTAQTRLEALTMGVAYSYMSGEGAQAQCGLDAIAAEVEAGAGTVPTLARLLDTALTAGAPPDYLLAALRGITDMSRRELVSAVRERV